MKFKPDLLVAWPTHLDYPLFVNFLKEERNRFGDVIIIATQMNTEFADQIPDSIDKLIGYNINFIMNDGVFAGQDWRNVAMRKAVKRSGSEWVWFTEQDFIPLEGFWPDVEEHAETSDVMYANVDGRMHPCCIFIRRAVLDKTSLDFAASPPEHDHFGQLQKDLFNPRLFPKPLTGHVIPSKLYHHMNGLSQNLYLLQKGEKPNYRPEEFKQYCKDSILYGNIHPDFKALFEKYINE